MNSKLITSCKKAINFWGIFGGIVSLIYAFNVSAMCVSSLEDPTWWTIGIVIKIILPFASALTIILILKVAIKVLESLDFLRNNAPYPNENNCIINNSDLEPNNKPQNQYWRCKKCDCLNSQIELHCKQCGEYR